MEIAVCSVSLMGRPAAGSGFQVSKFLVRFVSREFAGQAWLNVLHRSTGATLNEMAAVLPGKKYSISVSASVSTAVVQSSAMAQGITWLGSPGRYSIVAQIVEIPIHGEGAVVRFKDFTLLLEADQLPEGSLNHDLGAWLSFSTSDLEFWLHV